MKTIQTNNIPNQIINPPIEDIVLNSCIGIDLETTSLYPWIGKIDLITILSSDSVYCLEYDKYKKYEIIQLFKRVAGVMAVGHNIKFDASFIYYHTGVLLTNVHDTYVTDQIIENGRQSTLRFDLASVLHRRLNIDHTFKENKKELQLSFANDTVRNSIHLLPGLRKMQIQYAIEDVLHIIRLKNEQDSLIKESDLGKIYHLEHKLLPILVKMECIGIKIDKERWKYYIDNEWIPLSKKLENTLDNIIFDKTGVVKPRIRGTFEILQLFDAPSVVDVVDDNAYNYSSPAHIANLFKLLGAELPVNDGGKVSFDTDTLSMYMSVYPQSPACDVIPVLLEYKRVAKLLSTYGHSFLNNLDVDCCIHTNYTQTTTETGRLSSRNPNLQNIPKSGDDQVDIRKCFIARSGYKLITCDMQSAEVAIAGSFSGEKLLIDSLVSGVDMHSKLASITYSIIFQQEVVISKSQKPIVIGGFEFIPDKLRDLHKRGLFAKFYKAGPSRMYIVFAEIINKFYPQGKRKWVAKKISDALDEALPDLNNYLSGLINQANKVGYLRSNVLGRRRFFNPGVYGEAANYPIQETNASAQKSAMVRIDRYLETIGGRLLMNVHDETVSEVPDNMAVEASKTIQRITSESLSWFLHGVTAGATVNIGTHWEK